MSIDLKITELLFQRSEDALAEIQSCYGLLCRKIAFGILKCTEDTEECLNTAYLKVWNSIPPKRPDSLKAYLCSIVRNAAFDIYEKQKYISCKIPLEELSEIICDEKSVEELSDGNELSAVINDFLAESKPLNRKLFMARYYYNMSLGEMAERFKMSETAVKGRLFRIRSSLREYLSERGINV